MERIRSYSNIMDFFVQTRFTRDTQGRALVDVIADSPPQAKLCVDEWVVAAKDLSSIELASRLGITDRQARRIKSGDITTGRLIRWAEEIPELLAR